MTQYRICADTGVAQPSLSKFMSGQRGLSIKSMEKIAAYLKLELTQHK